MLGPNKGFVIKKLNKQIGHFFWGLIILACFRYGAPNVSKFISRSKTGVGKLDVFLYNNAAKIETQAKNLIKMEERLREVLYEMNFDTLKQSHR